MSVLSGLVLALSGALSSPIGTPGYQFCGGVVLLLFQCVCKCGIDSGCELRCWCGSLSGTSSRAGVTWRETKVVASSLDAVQSHVELASSLFVSRANESFSRSSSQRVVLDGGTELRYDTGFALQFRGVRIFNVRVTQFWTPHSGRNFMLSATAPLEYSKEDRHILVFR